MVLMYGRAVVVVEGACRCRKHPVELCDCLCQHQATGRQRNNKRTMLIHCLGCCFSLAKCCVCVCTCVCVCEVVYFVCLYCISTMCLNPALLAAKLRIPSLVTLYDNYTLLHISLILINTELSFIKHCSYMKRP